MGDFQLEFRFESWLIVTGKCMPSVKTTELCGRYRSVQMRGVLILFIINMEQYGESPNTHLFKSSLSTYEVTWKPLLSSRNMPE